MICQKSTDIKRFKGDTEPIVLELYNENDEPIDFTGKTLLLYVSEKEDQPLQGVVNTTVKHRVSFPVPDQYFITLTRHTFRLKDETNNKRTIGMGEITVI